MNFAKFFHLLEREEQLKLELDDEVDERSWKEVLDEDDEIEGILEFKKFIERFELTYEHLIQNRIILVTDGDEKVYFEFYEDGELFTVLAESADDMQQEVINMSDSKMLDWLGIEETDVYIDGWETTIKDAQENPGTVYHYTTEEGLEKIEKSKVVNPSYGTGLTNRHARGIFTSVDPEEYAMGTYGDICLALNLSQYKEDQGIDRLDLYPEPEVLEVSMRNLLYHRLQLDTPSDEASSDMSIFTMIVGHAIPFKYVTVI